MTQAEITFELRSTWVWIAFRLFAWMENKTLLILLDNAIVARMYSNGKLIQEFRLEIKKWIKDYECQT